MYSYFIASYYLVLTDPVTFAAPFHFLDCRFYAF